jgi:hypothetical protein
MFYTDSFFTNFGVDMARKSMKDKIADYMKRKAQERQEEQYQEVNKDYQPEREGFIPDRS